MRITSSECGTSNSCDDHNVDRGNNPVRVVVRIRPLSADERLRGCSGQPAIYAVEGNDDERRWNGNNAASVAPASPTGSVTSTGSHATVNSKRSFSFRGRKVLSGLLQNQNRRRKSSAGAGAGATINSSTVSPEPCAVDAVAANSGVANVVDSQNQSNVLEDRCDHYYPTMCASSNSQRPFQFDAVYGPAVTQNELYMHCFGQSLAPDIMRGYNTTIMAFGMTGAGKSYTMSERDGVVYHAVSDIFRVKRDVSASGDTAVTVHMSCLEIYTDDLRDLLSDDSSTNDDPSAALKLRDIGDSVTVAGLTAIAVDSLDEVRELLDHAQVRRTTGCTRLNEHSSRSHALYTLTVTSSSSASSSSSNGNSSKNNCRTAKLTLVDLAGSERIKESGVVGSQRKESIHINKDLFVLAKVIGSLHERSGHVPYRDSKLTRLLRDSLGGMCCACKSFRCGSGPK